MNELGPPFQRGSTLFPANPGCVGIELPVFFFRPAGRIRIRNLCRKSNADRSIGTFPPSQVFLICSHYTPPTIAIQWTRYRRSSVVQVICIFRNCCCLVFGFPVFWRRGNRDWLQHTWRITGFQIKTSISLAQHFCRKPRECDPTRHVGSSTG